ncbi:hypothetical protein ACE5IS_19435 [Leptospira wolffii]|uniref:Uncharacterized protein n=1 Tax=Leptospira wolffii TaxID=409998 RepID=A0ABV5BTT5_9LEPT
MNEIPKYDYLSISKIKERSGWSPAARKKFLGEPDKEYPNPHGLSSAPVKLFSIKRIEEIESSELFVEFARKNKKRILGAIKAVEKKKEILRKKIQETEFKIEALPIRELFKRAFYHYNHYQTFLGSERQVSVSSDKSLKKRLILNYVRHRLTNYDDVLLELRRKVGKERAYSELRNKLDQVILETYSWLARY